LIEAAERQPGIAAAQLFPEAAHANKAIFYREGRAATAGELYASLTRAAGSGAAIGATAAAAAPSDGFIQYASARNADHRLQQEELIALILKGVQPSDQMGVGSRLTGSLFTTEMLKLLSDSRRG
jgi:hypothetical protein